jgi:hypothetical protein
LSSAPKALLLEGVSLAIVNSEIALPSSIIIQQWRQKRRQQNQNNFSNRKFEENPVLDIKK